MRLTTFLFLTVLLVPGLAEATSEEPPSLRPEGLDPGEEAPTWTGPQIVQADDEGQVFLLRGNPLTVYPLSSDGRLGEGRPLVATEPHSSALRDAALSPRGRWLIRLGQDLFLFSRREGTQLPAPGWRVNSVGFDGETPLVGVLPQLVGTIPPGFEPPREPPLVLALRGKKWRPVVSEPLDGLDPTRTGDVLKARAVRLLGDGEELWIARHYRERVDRFTQGRLRTIREESELGADQAASAEQEAQFREELEERGMAMKGAQAIAFQASPVFQALAEGPDGTLYAINSQAGGGDRLGLERHRPGEQRWERILLTASYSGRLSLAAGADGLYFAAWQGHRGRWRLTWEALDHAEWAPILPEEDTAGKNSAAGR